ncbi:hypothetical protein E2562_032248 [Oryza meyeriana var. granulata]|uniref:Uncharacterized protein n=1 Tax=Oryza meyeriana var. granulata TaxID=110450 RepID=A0A6G1D9X6_9ORYZ|nr:hypothetical protein E2562_032248 [Oryza meyeriana var. granulata]
MARKGMPFAATATTLADGVVAPLLQPVERGGACRSSFQPLKMRGLTRLPGWSTLIADGRVAKVGVDQC